ncbi:MAG: hypothetical protein PHZ00_00825 [Candidatus Peribacteraceae bacterium]|nr:hypothetical protein [Candidatus Peribacteraceae bacterium]
MRKVTLTEGERLIRVSSEHWMTYVMPLFIYVLLTAGGIFFLLIAGYTVAESDWIAISSFLLSFILFLAGCHGFYFVVLGEFTSFYVITTQRVVHFKNVIILREEMSEVSFEMIKTVEASKRGFLQYLLNYGSLNFENKLIINYVSHPHSVARDVHQAMGMR